MSIFLVIHTLASRLQKSQRGAESQPTTFSLSSCSHTVTKAREEVSHQDAVPVTRVRGGKKIYTNKLTCTHTYAVPLQLPINILQDATFPHELQNFLSPFFSPPVRQVPTQLPISIPQRSSLSVQ